MKGVVKFIFTLPRRVIMVPLKLYRRFLSPLKGGPTCRFIPSCSEYALVAIERWGVIAGGFLALRRVLRCNPFCAGGYDPVPERHKSRSSRKTEDDQPKCEDHSHKKGHKT